MYEKWTYISWVFVNIWSGSFVFNISAKFSCLNPSRLFSWPWCVKKYFLIVLGCTFFSRFVCSIVMVGKWSVYPNWPAISVLMMALKTSLQSNLIHVWSISAADWCLILVGRTMLGKNLLAIIRSRYSPVGRCWSYLSRSRLKSPVTITSAFPLFRTERMSVNLPQNSCTLSALGCL